MGRRRKDGSSSEKGLGRGGTPPPNNKGKTYLKHIDPEDDNRKNNRGHKLSIYQDLDGEQLKSLCSIGCTKAEIMSVMGVSEQTLDKFLHEIIGMGWKAFFAANADNFKISLRRLQYKSAEGHYDDDLDKYTVPPSIPMQIWLGKQFLDQKDKHENIIEDKTSIPQFQWVEGVDVTNQKQLSDGEEENEDEDSFDEGATSL